MKGAMVSKRIPYHRPRGFLTQGRVMQSFAAFFVVENIIDQSWVADDSRWSNEMRNKNVAIGSNWLSFEFITT